ncbi:FAD-dependent oxidoreductase [Agrococcus baldri]|uniref:Oxidoreductase n=1 Tax=Agrococcus baldri TaxID=153730 RepID=A0AA87RBU5_9MICO|nr:NAD(P)/FAD-dependent oxidoreductase [Agrococcus baldri]GEK79807.1 oxidoreductase [Agrococcus baldri]
MTATRDVAIVGGGAVGLLLACLLAQRGIDVVVLERRTEPGRASRAFGIHPPGLAALDAAGVGAAVRAEALPIRAGSVLSGGRRIASLDFARPVHALPQLRTETILRERLAALAPAALRVGAEVVALRQHAEGVELRLAAGGCVGARWAVGADGVHGRVRRLLGIAVQRRRGAAGYAMADVDDRTGLGAAALLHLEAGGIVESFPLPDGRRRWVARLAEPAQAVSAERLQRILHERLGGTSALPAPLPGGTEPSAFLARQRLAARFASGRVALAGDAAHEVSPIGGQGMSLGWLDALALERALAAAATNGAATNGVARAAAPFAAYELERRPAAVRAMRRAAWNMAMGAPASPPALAARLALARVLALPPARSAMVAAFTMRGL